MRRERRGGAVFACLLRTMVRSRLKQRGLMVAVAAAVGWRYGVSAVAFSTRGFWDEKERSVGMLAFLFIPDDVGYTCCRIYVFRMKEGVAVGGGDHHGDAVFDRNLYGDPRRVMYRTGVLLGKLSTF